MENKDNAKEKTCPCYSLDCARREDCQKCQEYHHAHGSKTSCGK